jgi:hypothetical protein
VVCGLWIVPVGGGDDPAEVIEAPAGAVAGVLERVEQDDRRDALALGEAGELPGEQARVAAE